MALVFPPGALNCLKQAVSEVEPEWVPHKPHPKQAAFLARTEREVLFGGAASGGKSDAILMAALQYVDKPGYNALILRRTFRELALPEALMSRAREWLTTTPAQWIGADNQWRFPSGATLTFGYLETLADLTRYQSAAFAFIGWDELTHFEERQYRWMFSRCRIRTGMNFPVRIRSATNPGGIGHEWVKARWGIPDDVDNDEIYVREYKSRKGQRTRVFVPARRVDNPSTDQDEYDEMLEEVDDITRMQLDEGKWVRDSSGLVYHSFDEARNLIDDLPELPEGEEWSKVLGADFGVTKPTAFVELWFTEHDRNTYVVRSQQWVGMAPSDTVDEFEQWEKDSGGYDAVVGDIGGLGKGNEAEWAKRYFPMRAAKKADKLGYIKFINGDFQHRRVRILPGNDELVKDLKSLPWKDETHKAEHPNMPNHLPDALLYGWREARHWDWSDRPPPDPTGIALGVKQMQERKERVKARQKKKQQDSEDDSPTWDWSESDDRWNWDD